MAGEALSYVQDASLKGSAIVYWRFLNSPVTIFRGGHSMKCKAEDKG